MFKIFLVFLLAISIAQYSYSQTEAAKQTFSSKHLKEKIATHKIVAILPFETSITYKIMPKHFDTSAITNEEQSMAKSLQESMYTYLLRKSKKYTVDFQDVERTNALLKSKELIDRLDEITPDSICKILKVDAVIKCRYVYEKTASEFGAIATTILFGKKGSITGTGALTMQLYNGPDGDLLWRFYKMMDEKFLTSSDALIERMMRKVSRNFPYSN